MILIKVEVKLDYEFIFDESSRPQAIFSSGHEAISTYFSIELATLVAIGEVLAVVDKVEEGEITQYHFQGSEFQLRLSREGAEVIANALGYEVYEELPESTELYDQELQAECGLLDFHQALLEWQHFLTNK